MLLRGSFRGAGEARSIAERTAPGTESKLPIIFNIIHTQTTSPQGTPRPSGGRARLSRRAMSAEDLDSRELSQTDLGSKERVGSKVVKQRVSAERRV